MMEPVCRTCTKRPVSHGAYTLYKYIPTKQAANDILNLVV